MARPRTVSDEDMLAAARSVFLEHGASASTAVIAERLGVSQAAIFKRFGTKRGLMVASLAPPQTPPFLPLLAGGPDPDVPLDEQLRTIGAEVLGFLRGMVPAMMVLTTCGIDPKELIASHPIPPPLLAQRAFAAWFEQAMDLGLVRPGDPVSMATTLMGSLHIRAFLSVLTRQPLTDDDVRTHVDSVVDTLWFGLAPTASETPR